MFLTENPNIPKLNSENKENFDRNTLKRMKLLGKNAMLSQINKKLVLRGVDSNVSKSKAKSFDIRGKSSYS